MNNAALVNLDILGPAAPTGSELGRIAGAALHLPPVEIGFANAAPIQVPLFNMTTGGLWRITGTAQMDGSAVPGKSVPFSVVVKSIQSPALWSGIWQVPDHFRESLVRNYPWHTEARVYASDLANNMPDGGRLPEVFAINELDDQRTAIWLEDVAQSPDGGWTDDVFCQAAALLGRLAGSGAVRQSGPPLSIEKDAERLRYFLDSVGSLIYIPSLRGDELWQVPAVAEGASAELIAGLRSLTDRAHQLVDEILELHTFPAHGDASPQNLLIETREASVGEPGASPRFVVIDWGAYGAACAGFDLGQLLSGLVNNGLMSGEELYRLEPLCFHAYCDGLAESGADVRESAVLRGHAMTMALFTGLSAVPSQRLGEPDSEELRVFMAGRIVMARFVLDLLASTD